MLERNTATGEGNQPARPCVGLLKGMPKVIAALGLVLSGTNNASGAADLALPEEICASVGTNGCPNLTEANTNTQYVDLNGDGTKEMILVYGGGSCGSIYWVFELDNKMKWTEIGSWCGCEDGKFVIKKTKHNGYSDIWSCGNSGLFDGKRYVERRQ